MREGMTEADPAGTSTCDLWRPSSSSGHGAGSWSQLPPLITARTHARACIVQMSDGSEALVVVAGRARRMASSDIGTVEMLRLPSTVPAVVRHGDTDWTELPRSLPTRRRGFAVAACGLDRVAVVGGEARTAVAVVGGVVVNQSREALGTVEILDLRNGSWSSGPDLLRPRVHPRVSATEDGGLICVGGSLVPGVSKIAGERECITISFA